jgi:hypothetical protein
MGECEYLSDSDLRIADLADRYHNGSHFESLVRQAGGFVIIAALFVLPGALLMSVIPDTNEMVALKWVAGLAAGALVVFVGRIFDGKRFAARAREQGFNPARAREIFKRYADEEFELVVAANRIARKIAHAEHQ